MSHIPEPAGKAGPAVEYPPLPPGYCILDDETVRALSERIAIAEEEVKRLQDVLDRVPEDVRLKAEESAAQRKAKQVKTTITHWACFEARHRHQNELEAQACIDATMGVGAPAAKEGT